MKNNDFDIAGFRNAAPYINAHRDHTFIIAFRGEAIEDAAFPNLIHDIALLHSLGVKLILVHGARPQIEAQLTHHNLNPQYHAGLRITDAKALSAVKQAVGSVRVEIESLLSMGLINTPMSGMKLCVVSGNFVTARPLGVRDGIDFQHTGEVRKVDTLAIRQQLEIGNIILLSPLGYSPTGESFNLRATDVATKTASSLTADKLIFLVEHGGLRDQRNQLIRQLNVPQAQALLSEHQAQTEEFHLSLENAISACLNNVRRVHLIDRHIDGALLKELYTRDGSGTLITAETFEGLREATIDDAGGILELIEPLERSGVLVRRSREQLELEIKHFGIIERDGMIIGAAALYPFIEESVGELACLIVHPDYRNHTRGESLLGQVESKAKVMGLNHLFVLTTQSAHWFREHGFIKGDIDSLPVKRRRLYNYQRNAKIFFKELTTQD